MQEIKLPETINKNVQRFIEDLMLLYADQLIAVILYGSGAIGELSKTYSNINLLVVLAQADLLTLEKSRKLVHKVARQNIEPLFISKEFLLSSVDVFPIEFLDMKDNHIKLYGTDVLNDIKIDQKNLRFQCEQELKSKLILLKQQYLMLDSKDRGALSLLLFKNFTSVVHILKSALKLKDKKVANNKGELLNKIADEFLIDKANINEIWNAKRNSTKLNHHELRSLMVNFIDRLDHLVLRMDLF